MNNIATQRKTIPISFSREFEGLLLTYPSAHTTLTHDLELLAAQGIALLEELEDVHDLEHVESIKQLIARTNRHVKMDSPHFLEWHINIAPDLLDTIDLLLLAHGEDLAQLGLADTSQGGIVVMLVTANFVLDSPLTQTTQSVKSFSDTFKTSLELKHRPHLT